jgi:hypothetical protein
MIFKRIHADTDSWFSVFRDETGLDYVLVVSVPLDRLHEVAMRMSPDEVAMFRDRPSDFIVLAREFVTLRDYLPWRDRKLPFLKRGSDVIDAGVG